MIAEWGRVDDTHIISFPVKYDEWDSMSKMASCMICSNSIPWIKSQMIAMVLQGQASFDTGTQNLIPSSFDIDHIYDGHITNNNYLSLLIMQKHSLSYQCRIVKKYRMQTLNFQKFHTDIRGPLQIMSFTTIRIRCTIHFSVSLSLHAIARLPIALLIYHVEKFVKITFSEYG